MTVQVLFFSVLRERLGTSELAVTLEAPATGARLLDRLEAEHPGLAPFRSVLRLAVNHTYVDPQAPLHDGDEVALITPTSGG